MSFAKQYSQAPIARAQGLDPLGVTIGGGHVREAPTPDSSHIGIGSIVGGYRLVSLLGEGGMGAVYYGEHTLIGRRAAIKLLHSHVCREDIAARLFNEARAANDIHHANIVDITDFGQVGDRAYLIMEFLEGETLGVHLQRSLRVSEGSAARIVSQVCAAVGAAHQCGIIHRDLKPENIFLVSHLYIENFIKVLDFGIAKLVGGTASMHQTETGTLLGTPIYMSPEQCIGDARLDHRSDVYSLGVVLYEMVTGQVPFKGETTGSLIVAHVSTMPEPPRTVEPSISRAMDAIIMKALAKKPDDRFSTMAELRQAVDALERPVAQRSSHVKTLAQRSPAAPPPPRVQPASESLQRRRVSTPPPPPRPSRPRPPAEVLDSAAFIVSEADMHAPASAVSLEVPIPLSVRQVQPPGLPRGDAAPSLSEPELPRGSAPRRELIDRFGGIVLDRIGRDKLVLPTMPQMAQRSLALLHAPTVDLEAVASLIQVDPLLCTRLLKEANGGARVGLARVTTAHEAVCRLGARSVNALLLDASLRQTFESRDEAIRRSFRDIWEHSVTVGMLTRELSQMTSARIDPHHAYIAGALHDVGKPIVGALLLEAERLSRKSHSSRPWLTHGVWKQVVRDNHRQVALSLASNWWLPELVIASIEDARKYKPANRYALSNFVCYADALARSHRMGSGLTNERDAGPTDELSDDNAEDAAGDFAEDIDGVLLTGESLLGIAPHLSERLLDTIPAFAAQLITPQG